MEEQRKALHFEFKVQGGDFSGAGEASSRVKKILQQIGVQSDIVRRVAISCYEAEMNVVIHAKSGTVLLDADLDKVIVTVDDQGPGIEDIARAMTPGFSTAPDSVRELGFGAGMGLPNMKNNATVMEVTSEHGKGTTVRMVFENA